MFPLRGVSLYVKELHQRRLATEEREKEIAELMDKIDLGVMQNEFDKCLSLEQQGVWMLEYAKATGDNN